jgi:putative ABC transport system ATP-binding protein
MSIQIKSVTKDYKLGKTTVHALRGISMNIEQGEFVALVGPSGSGKSTALHILGALDRPTAGEVWIHDTPVTGMSDKQLARLRRERIGFIFQSFHLIPVLSVYANVEFPLLLMKVPKNERRERVMSMLESVGLGDRVHHKTEELSGGQRQRVAIARALVTNPSILLSDEPTANLDSKTSAAILDLMQKLNEEQQVTLVFATHDESIVSRARRIVRILDGEVAN